MAEVAAEVGRHFDREEQHRLKRDLLLKVAAACFNEKGYSGTSLKDVAERLNLTNAALYYYVKNKAELVYACYCRAADVGWRALSEAQAEGGSALAQVERYLGYHIDAMTGDAGPVAIMSEIPSLGDAHKADVLDRSRRHSRAFEALLEQGIGDGSIDATDLRMTTNAIMSTINWIPKWFHAPNPELAAAIKATYVPFLIKGLTPAADA